MDYKNNQLGATLFEILIVAGVTAVMGLVLSLIFINSNSLYITQTNKVNQGVGLNTSLSSISEAVRNTAFIATGYPTSSPTYLTSATTLVLAVPAIDAQGNVISTTYDYVVITRDSSNPKILRKITYKDPASSRRNQNEVLLTDLSLIQFNYLDRDNNPVSINNTVTVNVVINNTASGLLSKQSSASAQTRLRNL
jgi:hypothetical protein